MNNHLRNQDLADKGLVSCYACGEPATNRYAEIDIDIPEEQRWRCDECTPLHKGFFDLDYNCYGKGA